MSIEQQVICPSTGFICVIKENANAANSIGYLLKMRNALEGLTTVIASDIQLFVKNLTGQKITINTSMCSTVEKLKELIEERENIPTSSVSSSLAGSSRTAALCRTTISKQIPPLTSSYDCVAVGGDSPSACLMARDWL